MLSRLCHRYLRSKITAKKAIIIVAILASIILILAYFLIFQTNFVRKNKKEQEEIKIAQQGEDFLNSGNYQQAEKIFSQLATVHKDNEDYQKNWALALYHLGKYESAEKIYRDILANKEQAFAYNGLANVLRDRGIYESRQIKDETESKLVKMRFWQEAAENYQSAIRIDPKFLVSYNNLAQLLADQGKKTEAIKMLEQGIRANPDSQELKEALNIIEKLNDGQ